MKPIMKPATIRTDYSIDTHLLGRYNQRTNYAELVERHDYVDSDEEQGKAPTDINDMKNTPEKEIKNNQSTTKTDRSPVKTAKVKKPRIYKSQLALLIAAHDEEIVIEQTIRSAIKAGQNPKNIYVVDDNSSDTTSAIAIGILGAANVIRVGRSGKGLALTKAAHHFNLVNRYKWIHIADADGGFVINYFKIMRTSLNPKYAAASGYVRSLPSGSVGQYRVFEYTMGQELHRRFQALTHTVTVIPGPTSVFRADVFAKVNFANKSLTEDFDVTIQIHRQKLGKIQYIPKAVAYTQDPRNMADFTKQITRWNRGMMQVVRRHGIGRRANRIDVYLSYQIFQNFMFLGSYFFLIPYISFKAHSPNSMALAFLSDATLLFILTVMMAFKAKRYDIISAYPLIYMYRAITLFVFLRAFIDVIILRRFGTSEGIWGTAGRRYKNTVSI